MPMHGMRIGGGLPQMEAASQPAVMTEEAPEMMPAPEMPMDVPVGPIEGKVSQEVARYLGPEYRCAGCVRFLEGSDSVGECMVVDGPIAPDGVCGLFEPDTDAMTDDGANLPQMEASEAPIEEVEEE